MTNSFLMTRNGRPVKIKVRIVSSYLALMMASWWLLGAPASSEQTNRVPTQTPVAPMAKTPAKPWPL